MDFFVSDNWVDPAPGDLLISEPYLPDPNFERTVILICEHDSNGTVGFVLNRSADTVFGSVVKEVPYFKAPLFVGGPVHHDTLHFVHRDEVLLDSGMQIMDRVFWGGDFDRLMTLIDTRQINREDYKFFIGYSGWSPGQLVDELKAKSWIVYKNKNEKLIFDFDPKNLWKEVLKEMGGKYRVIANYPTDPRLN
ncbi:MAG: YqgE/AlgH family protein [Flammeovirgaceae bacterium]|jgi:putative transcriptional regulator|nr:YqgE/AlgH family protein [Flammeovirgaceae bacterium]|tara:strand:- start:2209 stop:2787 length:579 start_codon:yes stop_codon:yes gene_type:complete